MDVLSCVYLFIIVLCCVTIYTIYNKKSTMMSESIICSSGKNNTISIKGDGVVVSSFDNKTTITTKDGTQVIDKEVKSININNGKVTINE